MATQERINVDTTTGQPPPNGKAFASDSVGLVETQYVTIAEPPNELTLESGARVGPIQIAYETYGRLNADKSNAVLILHALSGDAHAAGWHSPNDKKPGWWDMMIGPGKAFDTNQYFVICSNVLGGCKGSTGPASINPATGEPYGLRFPILTISDMVNVQVQLLDHLGIEQLLCAAGGSMGGMQALEWAVNHSARCKSTMFIASTPRLGAQAIAFDAVGRNAIMADPNFNNGDYYGGLEPDHGLAIARMIGHITYLSDESMREKFGRRLRNAARYTYDLQSEFSVETYLDYQGTQFTNRFDANSYLYLTKAIDYFDMENAHGTLDQAVSHISGKMLALSYTSDWLYPPYQAQQVVYAMLRQRKDVTFCNIRSDYGHDAFLLENESQHLIIEGFLRHVMNPDLVRTEQPKRVLPLPEKGAGADAHDSIFEGHRIDYEMIADKVLPGTSVLDVGCGDGALLNKLIAERNVDAFGLDVRERSIVRCAQRGVDAVQGDIDEGLKALPDQSYDYVILSMTLQVIKNPEFALDEMLRVGKRCIVSFPNFGFWKVRLHTFFFGRAPITRNLPYAWYRSPNRHVLSIKDFRDFCERRGITIEEEVPMSSNGWSSPARMWPNLIADEALFVITRRPSEDEEGAAA